MKRDTVLRGLFVGVLILILVRAVSGGDHNKSSASTGTTLTPPKTVQGATTTAVTLPAGASSVTLPPGTPLTTGAETVNSGGTATLPAGPTVVVTTIPTAAPADVRRILLRHFDQDFGTGKVASYTCDPPIVENVRQLFPTVCSVQVTNGHQYRYTLTLDAGNIEVSNPTRLNTDPVAFVEQLVDKHFPVRQGPASCTSPSNDLHASFNCTAIRVANATTRTMTFVLTVAETDDGYTWQAVES